jgi:hypothetical protein
MAENYPNTTATDAPTGEINCDSTYPVSDVSLPSTGTGASSPATIIARFSGNTTPTTTATSTESTESTDRPTNNGTDNQNMSVTMQQINDNLFVTKI